jgi:hypothetical protein
MLAPAVGHQKPATAAARQFPTVAAERDPKLGFFGIFGLVGSGTATQSVHGKTTEGRMMKQQIVLPSIVLPLAVLQ